MYVSFTGLARPSQKKGGPQQKEELLIFTVIPSINNDRCVSMIAILVIKQLKAKNVQPEVHDLMCVRLEAPVMKKFDHFLT